MNYKTCILNFILSAGMFCLSSTNSAHGQEFFANQNLPSAPDVYRIEVKDLSEFVIIESGDPNSVGELHEITVELKAGNQKHGYKETSRSLYNATRQKAGNSAYVEVDEGDHIIFGGLLERRGTNRDLWVHAARENRGYPTQITLKVSARELDCTRERLCGRGNHGSYWKSFYIPSFNLPPPTTCGPTNTYRLRTIDDYLTLEGIEGATQGSQGGTIHGGQFEFNRDYDREGAIVRPFEAEICIASTRPNIPRPDIEENHLPYEELTNLPDLDFIRNVNSSRCLSLPAEPQRQTSPRAKINSCAFNVREGAETSQKWRLIRRNGTNSFSVVSGDGNYCLNLNNSTDNREGGDVKFINCVNHADQLWRQERKSALSNKFRIINVSSGKCLNVHGGNENRDFGNVSVYSCAESDDQLWEILSEEVALFMYNNPDSQDY